MRQFIKYELSNECGIIDIASIKHIKCINEDNLLMIYIDNVLVYCESFTEVSDIMLHEIVNELTVILKFEQDKYIKLYEIIPTLLNKE